MRIAFLGLGLIGGSIARALRAADSNAAGELRSATLVAWTPTGAGPKAALAAGAIDEVAPTLEAAVDGADLVILAAPPLRVLELLAALAAIGHTGLVTDVASTKAAIVARASELHLRFVGGHPLAGRDTSGFEAADAGLFDGRPWAATTDDASADDLDRVDALAAACRAIPRRVTAADHDAAVAGISHLPLTLAAALVEAVAGRSVGGAPAAWPLAAELAASGWRDMTRLARGDAEMGSGIAATNAGPLAAGLRDVRAILDSWIEALERPGGPDAEALAARLRDARARLVDDA
ncbi:MAG TPA: prephenate dehydrogenase/arogenate dehydrogenase family protein [Candidatus Polarisedimenticolia bacterium]|nr:prephenate dehydrogenase/arogenate dehydrogenase family protein [Candidatus Polarisedimenticolia bacterium]